MALNELTTINIQHFKFFNMLKILSRDTDGKKIERVVQRTTVNVYASQVLEKLRSLSNNYGDVKSDSPVRKK